MVNIPYIDCLGMLENVRYDSGFCYYLLYGSETSGLQKKTHGRNHGANFTFELWGEATYQP